MVDTISHSYPQLIIRLTFIHTIFQNCQDARDAPWSPKEGAELRNDITIALSCHTKWITYLPHPGDSTVYVHSITLQPSLSRFHPVSRNAPHEAPVPVWSPQNQVLLARPAFVVWSYVILWPIPVVALEQSSFNQSLAVATDFTCLFCGLLIETYGYPYVQSTGGDSTHFDKHIAWRWNI